MITVRVAHGISAHFITRFKEWVWAFVFLGMGFQLWRPDTKVFDTVPIYRVLAEYATEQTWGGMLFALGMARIIALSLNGTFGWFRGISPLVRSAVAFLCAGFWFALGAGFYLGYPVGITFIVFFGLMIGEIYNAWVIAGEAGTAYRAGHGCR